MARFTSKLDNVRIAAPCPANWESMYGNARVRFCGECQLNVYNLSAMSRADAEHLVAQAEGRLCVRYYRRRDGSIITQNCPVGLRALKRRLSRVATALATSVISFFAGIGFYRIADRAGTQVLTGVMAVEQGNVSRPIPPRVMMGDIAPTPDEGPVVGKMVRINPPRRPVRKSAVKLR